MRRVIHHRVHGLAPHLVPRVLEEFREIATVRSWRSDAPWAASDHSEGIFESEYLRHLRDAEGGDVSLGGFIRLGGDETDALVLVIFLRDLSAEHAVRVRVTDEDHPLSKLRKLNFDHGLLPDGRRLEDILAKRPVIKKVEGQQVMFYPPSFRQHEPSQQEGWGYFLHGLRAYAPSLLEAENEALKILKGMRHLGD